MWCARAVHAINSGIVKLGKLQKPVTVYRGVAGGVLPKSFMEPNVIGITGGVEAGFMSTTTDANVAIRFATHHGQLKEGQASMVFVIRMGMIDRGADVMWCSQFPTESEIVFAPLTGLEVTAKPKVKDSTIVVELRLSCNLRDKTMEEVLGKMKTSHIELIQLMLNDLKQSGAPKRTLVPLAALENEASERDASDFNVIKKFASMTERVLEAQRKTLEELANPQACGCPLDACASKSEPLADPRALTILSDRIPGTHHASVPSTTHESAHVSRVHGAWRTAPQQL